MTWASADRLPPKLGVVLHAENGMLGMGPAAVGDEIDPDPANAGKVPVTELPGAAYFHRADSFAMMRGGHLDVCVMGAFQISTIGAEQVYVMMTLFTKNGSPKLVPACACPLTGVGCVSRVYTDHAVFALTPEGVRVLETFGTPVEDLQARLEVPLLADVP